MYRSRIHFEKELVKVWGGGGVLPLLFICLMIFKVFEIKLQHITLPSEYWLIFHEMNVLTTT